MEQLLAKCIIPAAGLGTRFLPATKAIPKEMLPIVDTPTIQYIVEEAVAAGITEVVLISGRGKSSIEDHFDVAVELEKVLADRGKHAEREALRSISEKVRVLSIRQKEPLGLGHAVLCAAPVVGKESFGVALGDDLIDAEVPGLLQLARVHRGHGGQGVVALMEVPPSQTHLYGIAAGERLDERTVRIREIVEKPKPGTAPSNLAVIGRYVLPAQTMEILARTQAGVGGEIQLTDALAELAKGPGLLGYLFEGRRYDAGDKVGYLEANLAYALKRPEMREALLPFLAGLVKEAGA